MISKLCALKIVLGQKNVLENADIKDYTTLKVSCVCSFLVFPKTINKLKKLAEFLSNSQTPYLVLGAGSNVLFKNEKFEGVVVSLSKMPQHIRIFKNVLYADSATLVGPMLKKMLAKNKTNLEFLAGIPASVGGIICMNAGAFGLSVADFILKVKVLDNGKIKWLKKEDCSFVYRGSRFKSEKMVILGATFKLNDRNKQESLKIIKTFLRKRASIQPKGASCGSVFKNPDVCSAGFLIDSLNLKGTMVGGAMVSPVHANFIINNGSATGKDVYNLINLIKERVFLGYGINLETEVKIIGENENEDTRGLSHT